MSAIEETMLQKPNLRSKGSRFGIHTGNTLKWSTQDYLASRKDYGLIRKESLTLHTRDVDGRPPLVDDDGIGFEVEYSINRKRRWLLAEELEAAQTVVQEITDRVYSPDPSRSLWRRFQTKYTYRAKSDEQLFTSEPQYASSDPDLVAIVCNQLPHPRLRRQNATRLATTLEKHRNLRACGCGACNRRKRRHKADARRLPTSVTRTVPWHCSPSKLRKNGPTRGMIRRLNIVDLYELSRPLQACSFPVHHPCRNPARARHGGEKLKDVHGLRRL